jgi:hypothetical protein
VLNSWACPRRTRPDFLSCLTTSTDAILGYNMPPGMGRRFRVAILQGWKEIADHLHVTTRTAQRWEHFSLPVRRVSTSPCSSVVATSEDINHWAHSKRTCERRAAPNSSFAEYRSTQHRAGELISQLGTLWAQHRILLTCLKEITAKPL